MGNSKHPKLRRVKLWETAVSDKGLEHLSKMEDIECLELTYCESVTDRGIKHLVRLQSLKYLLVGGTQITDKSVGDLARMKRLEKLDLDETFITDRGLQTLTRVLPHTFISRLNPKASERKMGGGSAENGT